GGADGAERAAGVAAVGAAGAVDVVVGVGVLGGPPAHADAAPRTASTTPRTRDHTQSRIASVCRTTRPFAEIPQLLSASTRALPRGVPWPVHASQASRRAR